MKKTLRIAVVALAIALVATACSSSDSADGDFGEVKVGVENAYTPFNFIEDGTAQGFDYDIWAEICDRIGCEETFIEAGWPAVIEETGQGVPCMEAQADGAPCTELGRECEECEEAYEAYLRYRKEKGIVDGPVS